MDDRYLPRAARGPMRRAHHHWKKGEPLPLDLFYTLINFGIDVQSLEEQHRIS